MKIKGITEMIADIKNGKSLKEDWTIVVEYNNGQIKEFIPYVDPDAYMREVAKDPDVKSAYFKRHYKAIHKRPETSQRKRVNEADDITP